MTEMIKTGLVFLENVLPTFEFERNFNGRPWVEWTGENIDVAAVLVGLYLFLVNKIPTWVKDPWDLKKLNAAWNLCLSVFSGIGFFRVVPFLLRNVLENGISYTICEEGWWFLHGPTGLWVMLFIYSKGPELVDTIFLVLRGKSVIFLHWFHHLTVLLYCWHAYMHAIGPGIWFCAMNYTVHSIMYLYYFLASVGYYKQIKPIAPLVTTVQILQMVGGMAILVFAKGVQWNTPGDDQEACFVERSNLNMGLMMYFLYFVLFAELFYSKYCTSKNQKKDGSAKQGPGGPCTSGPRWEQRQGKLGGKKKNDTKKRR